MSSNETRRDKVREERNRERNRDAERQLTGDWLQTRNRLPARELKSSSLGFSGENSRVQRW
ncbi:hypothetical protein Hdeb2414_s0007g00262381 [Helianthus debilis subsp. tardiflorus]